jgi:hypothetical protein
MALIGRMHIGKSRVVSAYTDGRERVVWVPECEAHREVFPAVTDPREIQPCPLCVHDGSVRPAA